MAIQTRVMSTFEGGLVRFEFDYDDSTMHCGGCQESSAAVHDDTLHSRQRKPGRQS